VAPSRLVGVSATVNLPLHHKVQKFSSGTGSPGVVPEKRTTERLWCGVCVRESESGFGQIEYGLNISRRIVTRKIVVTRAVLPAATPTHSSTRWIPSMVDTKVEFL